MAITALYYSATQFKVSGDHAADYPASLRVQLFQGIDGQAVTSVTDATYDVGTQTTIVTVADSVVSAYLTEVKRGLTYAISTESNLCAHGHTTDMFGGFIPASAFSVAEVTNLQSIDIPVSGDENKFLVVETSYENGYKVLTAYLKHLADIDAPISDSPVQYDLIMRGAALWQRLAKGADRTVLGVDPADSAVKYLQPTIDFLTEFGTGDSAALATGTLLVGAGPGSLYLYDVDADERKIMGLADGYPFWTLPHGTADVRLDYVDANTMQLSGIGGTTKGVLINKIPVSVDTGLTLNPNSASDYIITGTTTIALGAALSGLTTNSYNNYGIHYVYLANSDPVFGEIESALETYDRRNNLFISAEAPTIDGYLSATGDGINARCVGMITLNSSRNFDNALCLVSFFNSRDQAIKADGSGVSWDTITLATPTTITGCEITALLPAYGVLNIGGMASFRNEDTDVAEFQLDIRDDSSVIDSVYGRAANGANYSSMIQMAITTIKQGSSSPAVVKANLAVTATGTDSSPTMRLDHAGIHVTRSKTDYEYFVPVVVTTTTAPVTTTTSV